LAISGPLWIGPLQDPALLAAMASLGETLPGSLGAAGARLLGQLAADPGVPPVCWPTAEIARRLSCGPPPLAALVAALQDEGWVALASGVMPAQLRSDAPWGVILQIAQRLATSAAGAAK
jgi:tRNA (guanine26-N2/guanine27-N2)-dimethyltransferase